jgi:hypothetical protein
MDGVGVPVSQDHCIGNPCLLMVVVVTVKVMGHLF